MAKKHFVAYSNMTKKQKILNFFKILGFSLAGIVAVVGAVVLYVYLKGDLVPGPVPLTEIYFESSETDASGNRTAVSEYVIDGNKQIVVTAEGEQVKQNGNLVWEQKKDAKGDLIYDSIFVGANEGCTELDAVLTIDYHSDLTSPIIQVVEDENCSPRNKDESDPDKLYYSFDVKINSPIYIKPLTKMVELNGSQVEANVGGWVKITITQGQLFKSCWIFVDDPILNYQINVDETKFEKDESYDAVNGYYNVYSNSSIKIGEVFNPENSLVLPSTNVPQSKGTTSFAKSKTVTYRILPDDIAEIDGNGNITIKPNREGETFSVQAFVISKYNDIGKEPTIKSDDPSQDETVVYNKEYNKIRVFSNIITFKINEIAVQGISAKSPTATPSFDVFEDGYITHSNTITTSTRNNYSVDIALTNEDDVNYKTALLTKVKLFIGKAQEIVDGKPVALSENDFVVWDADINRYKKLVSASNYITLTKTGNGTYHYVVNNYSDDNFYFVFYYELGEGNVTEILYDTIKFNIKENPVNKIEILSKENGDTVSLIKLKYDGDQETYSLTDNLKVNLTAKDTSKNPTYSYVMYFVAEDSGIVNTFSGSIKAKIGADNKICVPVCANIDGKYDFTKLVTMSTGQTKLYVAVVKTTTEYTGQEDVEFVYTADGFVDIELLTSVNLEVTSIVRFKEISYVEDESKNVERAITSISRDDQEYGFASDCQLFAEVYEEGKVEVKISYNGEDDAVKNNRLRLSLIYGTEEIAKDSASINGENGVYTFSINALNAGYAKFQVLYDDEEIYKIGIKVLSTELIGISLANSDGDAVSNCKLNVTFEVKDGETKYSWNDLLLDISYNSPKTESKSFELRTYALPEMFDEEFISNFDGDDDNEKLISFISLYQGKTFDKIIDNDFLRGNGIETLQKLVSKLTMDESVLKIYNNTEIADELFDAKISINDAKLSINDAETIDNASVFKFKVNSIGKVLVFAQSGDIFSNPILIETICPEIKVSVEGEGEKTEPLAGKIYAYSELTSIDGHNTSQNEQNLLKDKAGKQINFVASVGGEDYNINNLIRFMFEDQTTEGQYFISAKTGAKITRIGQPILTVGNIRDAETSENIIVTSEFGYRNVDFCQYTIISDYKLNNNQTKVYNTPAKANLFKGTTGEYPHIVVTNAKFDFGDLLPKSPNKLYLPKDFDVSNLQSIFPAEFLASFYYADPDVENPTEYYHIYKVLTVASDGNNAQNYYVADQSGEITLQYKKDEQAINFFVKTDAGQMSTSIMVKPGVVANFGNGYTVVAEDLTSNSIELDDKFKFDDAENYSINITDVNFAVKNPNDDLTFFKDGDNKRAETYVQFVPQVGIDYITPDEFDSKPDEEKNSYKYYYIQTTDISSFVEGKTYYEIVNGEFVEVENLDLDKIDTYFEKVYSTKTYYIEETNYKEIAPDELDVAYISKYYEEVTEGKYQKTTDKTITEGKKYYYKLNYKKLDEGSDITNVFDKLVLTLELTKDEDQKITAVSIKYDLDKIKTIISEINLTLSINAEITNTDDAKTNFDGLYFNITIQ